MKTAAKIFIIIGMIAGCWYILPLIFGFIALNKMKNAKSKSELTVPAILVILFCNIIGGVLMLCIPDSDFAVEEPAATSAASGSADNN